MAKTYNSDRYAIQFTHDSIARRPLEARIISRIVDVLGEAGDPVVRVWDSEEESPVSSVGDVVHLAYNLDELWLYTQSGAVIFLVMGQDWDILTDYSVSLEDTLTPVTEWIYKNM